MLQSDSSQEQCGSIEEERILQRNKRTLEQIYDELEPGPQLRGIDKRVIGAFIADLAKIGREMNALKNRANMSIIKQTFANSLDSIRVNIRKAIVELNLALDLLDLQDKLEAKDMAINLTARHDFYDCLSKCQEYIQEALQFFERMDKA